ncbi:membrane protein DedA, SNARE-associated domain [Jiangella alba]|uniref:Membrane protein DedA, SNARE-associated domain n=2 Tax=Jiangella alba TaxID=561176 RepID=A0A1H5MXB4_9ACTN|nr:DedA family protein [Jiangella alba]SEE93357.1 membrane protein DedA, SNARE-associated domain [Jiangella alba]
MNIRLSPETELTGLAGWAVDLMDTMGAVGAGLAIAAENLFPPLPSEVILPLAGFTASRGDMNLAAAIIWTTVGSVVGALIWYAVGAAVGRDRTRSILAALPLVKMSDVDKAEAWFGKHGVKTIFFGRMIPIFRSFISIPAGVERMSLPIFLAFTALGSAIWNTVFILLGYQLGQNWDSVEQYIGILQYAVIAAVVVAVAAFVILRVRSNRRDDRERARYRARRQDPR